MKNLLFVDDDRRVLHGLQRQLHIMRDEWNMNFVESGRLALEFMENHPVDVIISDILMPGMDGPQLLNEVTRRHPNTVRIALSALTESEVVMRLMGPAHQYLSKPCNSEDLRNAVARAFGMRDLLCNEKLKQLATRIKYLPSLPTLYEQLNREFRKDEPSIERIGEIISHDFGMTTKILQLVNSAFFGLPQAINNPTEAVSYLGMSTVRALVLSLQIFSQFENQSNPFFSLDALAQHCWLTGVAALRIARDERQDMKFRDQCFLAGLLHDVGQLILATGLSDEYSRILQAAKDKNISIVDAEHEHFGASHAEVGAYLLGLWGLPNAIIQTVLFHHTPSLQQASGFSPVIAVHVADVFMNEQADSGTEYVPPPLDTEYLTRIGLIDKIGSWR